MGYIQITVALLAGVLVFHVPIRGSLLQLYLLTLFFITASLGLGLMISNLAKNQMAGLSDVFLYHAAQYPAVGLYVSAGCHAAFNLLLE
jgi:uncharacterized membrane protein HdeD (DUF308 family)